MISRSDRVKEALAAKPQHENTSGWVRVRCVFCGERTGKEDRRGSLGVNVKNGFFHCFKCDVRGRLEGFDDFDIPEIDHAKSVPLPAEFAPLYDVEGLRSLALAPYRFAVKNRGIDRAVAREAGIGACLSGKYSSRIVIPIRNDEGVNVGFSARAIVRKHPLPYLYPEMDRAACIFNEVALNADVDSPVMLVEGVLDALALWPNACAVLGKISEWQTARVMRTARPVVIVWDGDAWEDGWALAQRFRLWGIKAGSVRLPPKTDPDEVDREALTQAALEAAETGEASLCPP